MISQDWQNGRSMIRRAIAQTCIGADVAMKIGYHVSQPKDTHYLR